MRIGMMSARQIMAEDEETFVGDISLGETSILMRQLRQCLLLGCEKIICLTEQIRPELIAMQHEAEGVGVRFLLAMPQHSLASNITADDQIIIINEGLVCDNSYLLELSQQQNFIASLPAETGVALGYERIDKDHAFAGVMMGRGALAEALNDLPKDADILSSLLRAGLQKGVPLQPLPPQAVDEGGWQLIGDYDAAQLWRKRRLEQLITVAKPSYPVLYLADRLALMQAQEPEPLGARRLFWRILTAIGLFIGPGIIAFGQPTIALFFLALAAFSARIAAQLTTVIEDEMVQSGVAQRNDRWLGAILDFTLFIQLGLAPLEQAQNVETLGQIALVMGTAFFTSAMVVGLIRLEAQGNYGKLAHFCSDRAAVTGLLGLASLAGFITPIIQIFAVLMLAHILWVNRVKK